jgi:hypothetical protein
MVGVTVHAKARARERLGVFPPKTWWGTLGEMLALRRLPSRRDDRHPAPVYDVQAVHEDGTEVPLAVAALVVHAGDGDYHVDVLTVYVPADALERIEARA